jgi:hypothetical protein
MEKERVGNLTEESKSFLILLEKAENGDKLAMENLLQMFNEDMEQLAKFIRLPKEDALQQLKMEFIAMVKLKNLD